jgi:hypothetical protein
MSLESLVRFANFLDKKGPNEILASNAIDMAIEEAMDSESPFENTVKTLCVFCNLLDADGRAEVSDIIDSVIESVSSVEEEIVATAAENDKKENLNLFDSLVGDIAKVEPHREGFAETGLSGSTLSSRTSPENPGVLMVRVEDGVYQDILTKKVYDFNNGWIDNQGNKHPGGSISNQTALYNQYLFAPQIFESSHLRHRPNQ